MINYLHDKRRKETLVSLSLPTMIPRNLFQFSTTSSFPCSMPRLILAVTTCCSPTVFTEFKESSELILLFSGSEQLVGSWQDNPLRYTSG